MHEVQSREELMGIIEKHTGATVSWGRTRRDKFEFGLAALLSVFLITAVWSTFTRGVDTVISMDIPVEYMNRPTEMEVEQWLACTKLFSGLLYAAYKRFRGVCGGP